MKHVAGNTTTLSIFNISGWVLGRSDTMRAALMQSQSVKRIIGSRKRRSLIVGTHWMACLIAAGCGGSATHSDLTEQTSASRMALESEAPYALQVASSPRQGSMLIVDWAAPLAHGEGDCIAIYQTGGDPSEEAPLVAAVDVSHAGEASGQVAVPLPLANPGPFEARYILEASDTVVATTTFGTRPVVPDEFTLANSGAVPRQGSLATIDWTAPADHGDADWIGLYRADADPADAVSYLAYAFINHVGETSGQVALQLPAGNPGPFVLRYMLDSTYTPVATAELEPRANLPDEFTVSSDLPLERQGALAAVDWTAPVDHGESDWIALYKEGTPASEVASYLTYAMVSHAGEVSGQVALQLPADDPGPFEVRYMLASTYSPTAKAIVLAPLGVDPSLVPGALHPQNTPFPAIVPPDSGGDEGIVELQLAYEAFFAQFERQAHDFLHEHGGLRALIANKSAGALQYHDTVFTQTRPGVPTALSGIPADRQMLLVADIDVVASASRAPQGAPLQHLLGKAWIMLTPDNKGLSYTFVDGYVTPPGSATTLPLVDPGQPLLGGRLDYPSLDAISGAVIFGKSMAHQPLGDSGVIAFRFSTRQSDDLLRWPGDRISSERLRDGGNVHTDGLLILPGGLFTVRTASALSTALRDADNRHEDVSDWSCCRETGWLFDSGQVRGPTGNVHSKGTVHGHGEVLGVPFSTRLDVSADVAITPTVTSPLLDGALVLGSRTAISWTSNAPGIVDGFINDAIKDVISAQPGMTKESEGDSSVTFVGTQSFPVPSALSNAYFSRSFAAANGISSAISFRKRAPAWREEPAIWRECESEPTAPRLTLSDADHPSSPLPMLLYPVVVDPPMPVDVRLGIVAGNGENQIVVSFARGQLAEGQMVTATIATSVGMYTWKVKGPHRPDPMDEVNCHTVPKYDPLASVKDCWACQQRLDPGTTVQLPQLVQKSTQLTVR